MHGGEPSLTNLAGEPRPLRLRHGSGHIRRPRRYREVARGFLEGERCLSVRVGLDVMFDI